VKAVHPQFAAVGKLLHIFIFFKLGQKIKLCYCFYSKSPQKVLVSSPFQGQK
jgi:hypothetical protein